MSVQVTQHDECERCPECGRVAVGYEGRYEIDHVAGCSVPPAVAMGMSAPVPGEPSEHGSLRRLTSRLFGRTPDGRRLARLDESEETPCPLSPDGKHCRHWYDGQGCHHGGAPAMTREQMIAQGMIDGGPDARAE